MEHQITALPIFCPKVFMIARALDARFKELTYEEVHMHVIVIEHKTDTYHIVTEAAFTEKYNVEQGLLIPTYIATKK